MNTKNEIYAVIIALIHAFTSHAFPSIHHHDWAKLAFHLRRSCNAPLRILISTALCSSVEQQHQCFLTANVRCLNVCGFQAASRHIC